LAWKLALAQRLADNSHSVVEAEISGEVAQERESVTVYVTTSQLATYELAAVASVKEPKGTLTLRAGRHLACEDLGWDAKSLEDREPTAASHLSDTVPVLGINTPR
jgi:hypothetical protein